ncbi:DUF2283 domain-containing protein [Fervidibacter sp.]|jgi:uncharacterized protein YuzE
MEKTLVQPEVMVRYDPQTDVLDIFIVWEEPPSVIGEEYIGEGILVHYDKQIGRIVGITIINATQWRQVAPSQRLVSREEVSVQLKDAFAPFPTLNRIFNDKWREERLQKVTVACVDVERLPLLLQWALLPTSPNPALKALEENISLLRNAGVKGLNDKLKQLKKEDDKFWSTLSELYLAAHFQRLGAEVTEFDPTTRERHKADFHFKVKVGNECWQGIVEVHTFYPPMQEEASIKDRQSFQIEDPVKLAWKRLRDKIRQLPSLSSKSPQQLHILAEATNLFPAEAQIPLFVDRNLFGFPEAEEILKDARKKGIDAVVFFAINPLFKLLFYIQWHWLSEMGEDLARAHCLFRDYPQKVPSNPMEIREVVLDYLGKGLITVEEASEILRIDPDKIALQQGQEV